MSEAILYPQELLHRNNPTILLPDNPQNATPSLFCEKTPLIATIAAVAHSLTQEVRGL